MKYHTVDEDSSCIGSCSVEQLRKLTEDPATDRFRDKHRKPVEYMTDVDELATACVTLRETDVWIWRAEKVSTRFQKSV